MDFRMVKKLAQICRQEFSKTQHRVAIALFCLVLDCKNLVKTPVKHGASEPSAFLEPAPPCSTPDDAAYEILTHQQSLANNAQQAAAVLHQAADKGVSASQDGKDDVVATNASFDSGCAHLADAARHCRYQRFESLMLAYVVCFVLYAETSACCQLSST